MVNIGIKSKRVSVVVIFIGWNINMDISRWTFAASARLLGMLAAVSVLRHGCEHLRIGAVMLGQLLQIPRRKLHFKRPHVLSMLVRDVCR